MTLNRLIPPGPEIRQLFHSFEHIAQEGWRIGSGQPWVVPSVVDTLLGREASRQNPERTARRCLLGRQATAWELA